MHEEVSGEDVLAHVEYFRERSEFEKKGIDEDVINLRFKHYQNRLIDILNRVLDERRRISKIDR